MAIPESIKKKANQVRNEVYGKDVREALASGIEEAGDIADQANTKSDDAVKQVDNIQAQVDQLVVEGDSSVEAAQARVDAEGRVYTTLKERIDAEQIKIDSSIYGSVIQTNDLLKIKADLENDRPVRMAILGDSTKAGVGWRFGDGHSGYGEFGDIDRPSSPEIFFLNLIMSSPYFYKPSEKLGNIHALFKKGVTSYIVTDTATSLEWDRYILGRRPDNLLPTEIRLNFKHMRKKRDKMGIYYLARTAPGALAVDITCGGITTTVSSRVEPQTFGTTTVSQQNFRLECVEIDIPTDTDEFEVVINNPRWVVDSPPTGGTFNIVGFYYGRPPMFKNLAVRSTTLMNDTERNINKGVTTSERLQKAYDFGANIFYLGWGTNDLADGYSVETIGNELRKRIDEIRAFDPSAVIIIDTVWPRAGALSLWEEYKKIALEKKCSFFDACTILQRYKEEEVINDYVHQNEFGYKVVGKAMTELFSIESPSKDEDVAVNNTEIYKMVTFDGQMQSNFTGANVEIMSMNVNGNYGKVLLILVEIAIDSDVDLVDTRFDISYEEYSLPDLGGSMLRSGMLNAKRFHMQFPEGSTAKRAGALTFSHVGTMQGRSWRIFVQGRNFALSPVQSATRITAIFLN